MKIYSWKRLLTFIAIVLLFIGIILHQCTIKKQEVIDIKEYTVQSGETLWSIASAYRPEHMSIQEYIYNLKEYNNIGSMVYANQKLQILIYEEV